MSLSDIELLNRIAGKDEAAFKQLYDKYWRLIYRWVSNRIYDQEAVRDLLQNYWADIWINPAMIKTDKDGCAKSILLGFISYRILDFFKKKNLLVLTDNYAFSEDTQTSGYTHVFEEIEIHEAHRLINEFLDKLPALSRNIYLLHERENYTVHEISHKLSVTEDTVRRHLASTHKMIRRHFGKYYPGDAGLVLLVVSAQLFR